MKKVLKWVGIGLVGLMILGMIIEANKSPEQKVAEAAVREQERIKQAENEAAEAVVNEQVRIKKAEKKQEQAIQDGVPKCDSTITKDTLKNAFDQSQFARTLNLSMIEISAPQENAFDSKSRIRTCSGIITMNNTEKVDAKFNIEGRTDGQFMLTVEVAESTQTP